MKDYSINPTRIKFARQRRQMTSRQLSQALGITPQMLSQVESGRSSLRPERIFQISKILRFPEVFFYQENLSILQDKAVSFRSLARMTATTKNAALAAGALGLELAAWIEQRFEIPENNLPDLRRYSPQAAAETLRDYWCLGQRPIANVIHLLESKGVFVFSLAEETFDMDAFSLWQNAKPYIFLNTKKTVERTRFDAAHELGHLVLHQHAPPQGKNAEKEANQFASAFLMPEPSVRSQKNRQVTFCWLLGAKHYWKVSLVALVRRLYDLELINEYLYKKFIIENNTRGGVKTELNPMETPETSKLLSLVFQALRKDAITQMDIANDLKIHPSELRGLIFNLSLISLEGKRQGGKKTPSDMRGQLKVIKGSKLKV